MYLAHFGLDEPPFRITPHTEFFFAGARRGATLEGLIYAITHDEGIVKVTGEVGSGKTMLCRVLIERMPDTVEVLYLANPSVSRDEILDVLAADLGAQSDSSRTTLRMRALQDRLIALYGQGRRVVVLIDEAHAMPPETLEEIRLLSNLESNQHKLLQIVLFGQPELDEQLASPDMRQLRERITQSFHLEPLVRTDVEQYIDFRMRAAGYRGPNVFSAPALRAIADASEGLTRRINILADKALLAAFADGAHAITTKHARAAIRDANYRKQPRRLNPWLLATAALILGVAMGFATRALQRDSVGPTIPAAAAPTGLPAATTAAPTAPIAQAGPAPSMTSGLGPLAHKHFEATQAWLPRAPDGEFTIHLATYIAEDSRRIEDLVTQTGKLLDPAQIHVYGVRVNGRQHYAVAYGLYPSAAATIAAMNTLPDALRAAHPYQRSVAVMRKQNAE